MPNAPSINAVFESSDYSPNFDKLLHKLDNEFARPPFEKLERFQFSFDGLNFDVRRGMQGNNHKFLINATIGYMPFTIESAERREAIKTIIIASRTLPHLRFGANMSGKISAGALIEVPKIVSPDFVFYPLTLFMQEGRPFIKLIGQYLSASPNNSKKKTP